jgi:hypothetical protein
LTLLIISLPDWLEAGQSDIPAFKKGYTLYVHTAGDRHRQLLMVLFLLYDIEKSYVNAGMPEKS